MKAIVLFAAVALASGCAARKTPEPGAPPITAAEARAIDTYGLALRAPDDPAMAASHGTKDRGSGSNPDAHAPAGWQGIGHSVQGRPILAATIPGSGSSRSRLLLVGSIHGTEREGLGAIDRFLEDLRANPLPVSIRIIRDMNPDGTAAGTRGNARGVDLNRNWPAASFIASDDRGQRPLSEPEALAVWRDIERFDPTLVIVLHSTAAGPYVNYDGPAVEAATLFAGAALARDPRWRLVADMGYPTPGSLGSLVGDDRGVPILTIEFDRGQSEESVWVALRDGVRAVAR